MFEVSPTFFLASFLGLPDFAQGNITAWIEIQRRWHSHCIHIDIPVHWTVNETTLSRTFSWLLGLEFALR